MQTVEPYLHFVNPFEILYMFPILDDLLPLDEVLLVSLIHYDLILDIGSVVTKSNPDLLRNPDIRMHRYSYVGIFEFLDSPFEHQVGDPNEFDFSYEFFNSHDTKFVLVDSISPVDFFFSYEVYLIDYKSSDLGTM